MKSTRRSHLVAPTKDRLKRTLTPETGDDSATKTLKKKLNRLVDEKFAVKDQHLMATMLWPPFRRLEQFRVTVSASDREQAVEDLISAAAELDETIRHEDSSDEDDPVAQASQPGASNCICSKFLSFPPLSHSPFYVYLPTFVRRLANELPARRVAV